MKARLACVCLMATGALVAFEKIALVDGFDYAPVMDTETDKGMRQVLARVCETGADTILWRTHSGGIPRYASEAEDLAVLEQPLDKRRVPLTLPVRGWVRYQRCEPDALKTVYGLCAGMSGVKRYGAHLLQEDAHSNRYWSLGEWTLEHPQYWCRSADGKIGMHHASFAYPEVIAHRRAIVREILARGAQMIYLDTTRNGGYGPRDDYVKPNLDEWARRHPGVPVPKDFHDPRWLEVVARGHYAYYRAIREEIRASGRDVPFVITVGNMRVQDGPDWNYAGCGFDWRKVVDEGLVDGLAVVSIAADEKDPFGSTERIFRHVAGYVKGRCKTYFPIRAYNFAKSQPSYGQLAKWAGVTPPEAIRRLLEIAARCGAAGIVMECVDPGNYPAADCEVIRNFAAPAHEAPTTHSATDVL